MWHYFYKNVHHSHKLEIQVLSTACVLQFIEMKGFIVCSILRFYLMNTRLLPCSILGECMWTARDLFWQGHTKLRRQKVRTSIPETQICKEKGKIDSPPPQDQENSTVRWKIKPLFIKFAILIFFLTLTNYFHSTFALLTNYFLSSFAFLTN